MFYQLLEVHRSKGWELSYLFSTSIQPSTREYVSLPFLIHNDHVLILFRHVSSLNYLLCIHPMASLKVALDNLTERYTLRLADLNVVKDRKSTRLNSSHVR